MFEWKPEYSVKIPEIDTQHQRLFALAAELHLALTHGRGYTLLEQCLSNLVDYTKVHFASEESLMAQCHFPRAAEHKMEHDKLAAQVLDLQQKFREGEGTVSMSLLLFLKNWLENHIAGSDQQYSKFLRGEIAA